MEVVGAFTETAPTRGNLNAGVAFFCDSGTISRRAPQRGCGRAGRTLYRRRDGGAHGRRR